MVTCEVENSRVGGDREDDQNCDTLQRTPVVVEPSGKSKSTILLLRCVGCCQRECKHRCPQKRAYCAAEDAQGCNPESLTGNCIKRASRPAAISQHCRCCFNVATANDARHDADKPDNEGCGHALVTQGHLESEKGSVPRNRV